MLFQMQLYLSLVSNEINYYEIKYKIKRGRGRKEIGGEKGGTEKRRTKEGITQNKTNI